MRVVVGVVLSCCIAMGQSAADAAKKNGSIAGVVIDSVTGTPIADASVAINRIGVPGGRREGATDSQGRYSFTDLDAGQYRLSAYMMLPGMRGFGAFSAKTVTLAQGQDLTSANIPVRLFGTITGRVLDENKEPIQGAQVFLVAREYSLGSLRHVFASVGVTDDRGLYSIGRVEPGRGYLLMVRKANRQLPAISELPEDPKMRRRVPAPTYYPGSTSLDGAQPLVLRPGETRENVDLRMMRAASFCIEGSMAASGTPGALIFTTGQAKVTSGRSGTGGFYIAEPGAKTGDDGKVRMCEVTPGEYRVSAFRIEPPGFFGVASVNVVDRDVKDVILTALPHIALNAEVAWHGQPPEQQVEGKLLLLLNPLMRSHFMGETMSAQSPIPGQLTLPNVFADEYAVEVRDVPPGLYIKSITYGNADVMHEPLRIGSAVGNASLRIVIARDGGTVQTRVADKDGNPVADSNVVLLPADVTAEAALADVIITGQADQNGAWKSNAMAPGKYLAFATMVPVDKTPESIHKLWNARPHAAEVEIAPNGSAQVTLSPRTLD